MRRAHGWQLVAPGDPPRPPQSLPSRDGHRGLPCFLVAGRVWARGSGRGSAGDTLGVYSRSSLSGDPVTESRYLSRQPYVTIF